MFGRGVCHHLIALHVLFVDSIQLIHSSESALETGRAALSFTAAESILH